jgi:hypothetical protein
MENSEFQKRLDEIIDIEKNLEPNPFQATRILQRIDSELLSQKKSASLVWMRVLQPVAISMALVIGILIGSYTARSGQNSTGQEALTKTENRENLKADLFISTFTDEDNILNLNN